MHFALERLDAHRLRVRAHDDLDVVLYANERVFLDAASVDEVVSFTTITDTLSALNRQGYFGDVEARIERVVLTPTSIAVPASPWAPCSTRAASCCRRPWAPTSVVACGCWQRT